MNGDANDNRKPSVGESWRLETVEESVSFIRSRLPASFPAPEIGVVCGSGCAEIADAMTNSHVFKFEDIPHFSQTSILGHKGK